jgi:STAM-binding protein
MNRETCGLLLGKLYFDGEEPGSRSSPEKNKGAGKRGEGEGQYVVTTLLVPKQHGTSDMCSMDEEELVMQFVDERSLITLGWVSLVLTTRSQSRGIFFH